MTIKKISVFCGAHLGKSPEYKIAAEQIGKLMAEKNLEVIFGGGNVGVMKVVADSFLPSIYQSVQLQFYTQVIYQGELRKILKFFLLS
jgi:predicted Rossmann-fold nucleotide-binding protein